MPLPLPSLFRWLIISTLFLSTPAMLSAQPVPASADRDFARPAMAGPSSAQRGHGPMQEPPHHGAPPPMTREPDAARGPEFLRHLRLTEDQRDRVFTIMHAIAPGVRDKAKTERRAREALRQLAVSAEYSETKARTLADEAAKAQSELALIRAGADHEIWLLLTPQQREQATMHRPPRSQR